MIEVILTIVTSLLVPTVGYLVRRIVTLEKKTEARYENEISVLKTDNTNLLQRVSDLEEKAKRVPEMEKQISVMVSQLESLQTWKIQAESQLEDKDKTIEEKQDTIKEQAGQLGKAEQTIKAQEVKIEKLTTQVEVWREVVRELGLERQRMHDEGDKPHDQQSERLSEPVGTDHGVGRTERSADVGGSGQRVDPGGNPGLRGVASQGRTEGDPVE